MVKSLNFSNFKNVSYASKVMLITELLNQYRDLVKYMMKLSGCADYISLTDLARHKSDEPNAVIANWMRNRNTIEYLGIWEQLYV